MPDDSQQPNSDRGDQETGVTRSKLPRYDTSASSISNTTSSESVEEDDVSYYDDSEELYQSGSDDEMPVADNKAGDEKFLMVFTPADPESKVAGKKLPSVTDKPHTNEQEAMDGPLSAPPLTPGMLYAVKNPMIGNIPMHILQRSKVSIKDEDLKCLKPRKWLTDDLIDYYLELIRHRNQDKSGRCANVFMSRSIFYPLLEKRFIMSHPELSRSKIQQYDMLFFPVCKTRHWRLIVADPAFRSVTSYNSLSSESDHGDAGIVNNVINSLDTFDPSNPRKWERVVVKNVPQQGKNNDDDCGVFISQFADYLSRGLPFDFADRHMPYFRKKMAYECLHGRILT